MNREQAKIYAKLSREDIAKIESGLAKHYEVLCAYANGAEIEIKDLDSWILMEYPSFSENEEYRVMPSAEQPAEPWKPKYNERFLYIGLDGKVMDTRFDGTVFHHKIVDFGNCFKSYEEADNACERVRAALKGETISKTETVENKSHVVELSEKLGEPSIAVFHCDGKDGERGAAVELDDNKQRVLTGLSFLFISLFRRGYKADDLNKVLEITIKHFYEHGKTIKVEEIKS